MNRIEVVPNSDPIIVKATDESPVDSLIHSSKPKKTSSKRNKDKDKVHETSTSISKKEKKKTKKSKSKKIKKKKSGSRKHKDQASIADEESPKDLADNKSYRTHPTLTSDLTDDFSQASDSVSDATVGTSEFYRRMISKLEPHRNSICMISEDAGFQPLEFSSREFSDASIVSKDEKVLLSSRDRNESFLSGNVVSNLPKALSSRHRNESFISDLSEDREVFFPSDNRNTSGLTEDSKDFRAAFAPTDMRCLALVSHNGMKATMKEFVINHKHILKKFRLTGTKTTMTMIQEVFGDDPSIVYGPTCSSGPLGGDAELVGLMTSGQLGGILFFQDPMSAHPHHCDIECLVRQAMVHNTMIATTPVTAMALVEVFRWALEGRGKPELLPSFFFSLECPTARAYKRQQADKLASVHTSGHF